MLVELYNLIFLYIPPPKRFFSSCTRPAGPAEIRESAPATVLTLGTQAFFTLLSPAPLPLPPRPVPACQGRPQLQQGRLQRPGWPAAAATAAAAVALRASSGAFPPYY